MTFHISKADSLPASGSTPCHPFRVHQKASLPPPPTIDVPEDLESSTSLTPAAWEISIPRAISRIKTQEGFSKHYKKWLEFNPVSLTEKQRYSWLQCLHYYVKIDTNGNGIPDWSALVDNKPTRVLPPQDQDMDGDGVTNVWDPAPLVAKKDEVTSTDVIPDHIRFHSGTRPEAALYQKELFQEFNILTIDHTDRHSPVVLKELLLILRQDFLRKNHYHLKNFKFLYAFEGHDRQRDIAAYHVAVDAISVGGMKSYSNASLSYDEKIDLLCSLSHEIGHALLFKKVSPLELLKLTSRFGQWPRVFGRMTSPHFYSSVFFHSHPLKEFGKSNAHQNIPSQYAMKNRHEWFAEAFTAYVMNQMGEAHLLGTQWHAALIKTPPKNYGSWVNYNNISLSLKKWFTAKLGTPSGHSVPTL